MGYAAGFGEAKTFVTKTKRNSPNSGPESEKVLNTLIILQQDSVGFEETRDANYLNGYGLQQRDSADVPAATGRLSRDAIDSYYTE